MVCFLGYIESNLSNIQLFFIFTVAKIVATPYLTTTVSILLVSVDNSHMHIYNSLITQRNNWITP